MPKYCPVCLGEFRDTVDFCPKDQSALTKTKPKQFERLVDIYAANDEIEAERIIALLISEGLTARESVSGISQLPVASDTQFFIAVLQEDVEKAKQLVEQAKRDGIISSNGSFL